jgi:death on curing protein
VNVEITFLSVEEVLEAHRVLIERYGGSAELRDMGLLQSALAMPSGKFGGQYLHSFPEGMAAVYLFHLVANHAFVDGNKRIGAVAARLFLLMNECQFDPTEEEYGDLVLAVASGKATKDEVIEFFKRHVRKTPG